MNTKVAAVLLVAALALVQAQDCPTVIKVASINSLSGPEQPNGPISVEGWKMGFNDTFAESFTLNGCAEPSSFLLTIYDGGSNATASTAAANQAIADGNIFITGTGSSLLTDAVADVTEPQSILYINVGGSASTIYTEHPDWIFGLYSSATTGAQNSLTYLHSVNTETTLTMAVLWVSTSFGPDYVQGVNHYVAAHPTHFQVVFNTTYTLNTGTEFEATLDAINARADGVDVILVAASTADFIRIQGSIIAKCVNARYVQYFARGFEVAAQQALTLAGVNTLLTNMMWSDAQTDAASVSWIQAFNSYEQRTGGGFQPSNLAALSWLGAKLLITAIKGAGSVNSEAVRDYIVANPLTNTLIPGGNLTFNSVHQSIAPTLPVQIDADGTARILHVPGSATILTPNPLVLPGCSGQLSGASTVAPAVALLLAVMLVALF